MTNRLASANSAKQGLINPIYCAVPPTSANPVEIVIRVSEGEAVAPGTGATTSIPA